MTFSEAQILQLLGLWLWPFIRIAGFVMAAPVLGTRAVPVRIRVVLVMALTGVLVPGIAPAADIDPLGGTGLLTAMHQFVVGATIGLVLRLVFVVFEFSGQLIAQQMGLSFAAMVDPTSGAQVPVLSHLYIILATLLFFALDTHLVLIKLLGQSFELLPVGPQGITAAGAGAILDWSSQLIADGLLLSLPIVVALLAINFAFGVMARAAPQLNVLAVGFPVMLIVGVFLLLVTLPSFGEFSEALFERAFATTRLAIGTR